jgi:uncharacterized protein
MWIPLLALTVVAGYMSGQLAGPAAAWIALLAAACQLYVHESHDSSTWASRTRKAIGLLGLVTLSLGLSLHRLPGFHNLLLQPPTRLTANSAPYQLWLEFDKTIAGLLVLAICCRRLIQTPGQFWEALRRAAVPCAVTIVAVVSMSVASGFVRWDPKWSGQFWIWATLNLLSTCMSEEAFFRGFIQAQIASQLASWRRGPSVAIGCSAALFGIAHIAGGWHYALLASLAGAGYAIVFHRSTRIEMSMLTHFGLNSVHFLLFTYPVIAPRIT